MKDDFITQFNRERRGLGLLFVAVLVAGALTVTAFAYLGGRRQDAVAGLTAGASGGQSAVEIERELAEQKKTYERLSGSWEHLRTRTDTFQGRSPLLLTDAKARTSENDARIDFKVALFNARAELREQAAENNVALPEDLGLEETIGAEEDAETRLWQLASVVKLMQICIDLRVPFIDEIEALPPTEHTMPPGEDAVAKEFPVVIHMRCSTDTLGELLVSISGGGPFFALRGISIERLTADERSLLRVVAVCGAELFQPRSEGEPVDEEADIRDE